MSSPLVYPMAAHVGLTAFLYVALTVARAPSVWGLGRQPDGCNPWASVEPRISANLSNQFEWPLFFYVAGLLMIQQHAIGQLPLSLAWLLFCGALGSHLCPGLHRKHSPSRSGLHSQLLCRPGHVAMATGFRSGAGRMRSNPSVKGTCLRQAPYVER